MTPKLDIVPGWAFLVEGRVTDVKPLFLLALRASSKRNYRDDGFLFIDGESAWCGVFCEVAEDPPEDIANLLREHTGRNLVLLNFGVDPDWTDEPYVSRWNGAAWTREYGNPSEEATTLGVTTPAPSWSIRSARAAALVEGVPLDVVKRHAGSSTPLSENARGVVIRGDLYVADRVASLALRVYQVIHFLDNDEFHCSVSRRGEPEHVFSVGAAHPDGLPLLPDVDGATDPRAIVRQLDIPVDLIFPDGW